MSNTKGSMLISNANAVGTELVNQLGGTGYKPSEWSDAINLLGISDDDKASALAGITEGTYTGTERGAIKYSNCNAVGAMLNKKFSTNRGFKPVEWESAISKLTPLTEGTVSGSVCNIVNGAEDVPLKNWLVTLPASLDGYTEVNGTKAGKNLLQNLKYQATSNRVNIGQSDDDFSIPLRAGTYTLSVTSSINVRAYYRGSLDGSNTLISPTYSTSYSGTFTLTEDKDVRMWVIGQDGSVSTSDILTIQLEVGSTATAYEAYEAPTQYTADLGRTIYGGTADIVTGEGEDKGVIEVFDTVEGNVIKSQFNSFNKLNGNIAVLGTNVRITFAIESGDQSAYNRISNTYTADEQLCNLAPHSFSYASDTKHWYRNTVLYLFLPVSDVGTTAESVYNYLNGLITNGTPLKFYLPYNTETAFTFTPIQADTELGVNNFWSEHGDSSITYRKDPDIPDPPVQLLNMNNNENNNNEGV